MKQRLFIIAIFLVSQFAIAAEPLSVRTGFFTGNEFVKAPDIARQAYVLGAVDISFAAPMFGAPQSRISNVVTCLTSMHSPQILAIVDRYLINHPEQWDLCMNVIFILAIGEACKSKGLDISPPK